jgi:hypothetical protein
MLIYQNTIEEYSFVQSTRTEKQSFATLIQEKAKIVPSFEQVQSSFYLFVLFFFSPLLPLLLFRFIIIFLSSVLSLRFLSSDVQEGQPAIDERIVEHLASGLLGDGQPAASLPKSVRKGGVAQPSEKKTLVGIYN